MSISDADQTDELIGAVIDGRFAITGRIGQGGMGTVYRATQTSMGREVAVKMMRRDADLDAAWLKRFLREAKLASQLAHPNTVSIIDFGEDATGRPYLVMELLRGETLHAIALQAGALSLERVVRIGVQISDALAAAAELQIIHRDLKPDNIIVLAGDGDHIKVLDFGLARVVDDTLTNLDEGVVAGTPRYLAPEAVKASALTTPAQDVYALGVILAELASGNRLWPADTIARLFAMKAAGEMNMTGVPPALVPVVKAMLAIDPTARPSAREARAKLQALIDPVEINELRPTQAEPPPIPLAASLRNIKSSQLVPLEHAQRTASPLAPPAAADIAAQFSPAQPVAPRRRMPTAAPTAPATVAASASASANDADVPTVAVDPVWLAEKKARQAAGATGAARARAEAEARGSGRSLRIATLIVVALAIIVGGISLVEWLLKHHK